MIDYKQEKHLHFQSPPIKSPTWESLKISQNNINIIIIFLSNIIINFIFLFQTFCRGIDSFVNTNTRTTRDIKRISAKTQFKVYSLKQLDSVRLLILGFLFPQLANGILIWYNQ